MTKKKLFVIFSSETTLILIHLSHGTKFDPKSPKFKVSHLARGGGLNPNETLSHSNGKFVFDHGPYLVLHCDERNESSPENKRVAILIYRKNVKQFKTLTL